MEKGEEKEEKRPEGKCINCGSVNGEHREWEGR